MFSVFWLATYKALYTIHSSSLQAGKSKGRTSVFFTLLHISVTWEIKFQCLAHRPSDHVPDRLHRSGMSLGWVLPEAPYLIHWAARVEHH